MSKTEEEDGEREEGGEWRKVELQTGLLSNLKVPGGWNVDKAH